LFYDIRFLYIKSLIDVTIHSEFYSGDSDSLGCGICHFTMMQTRWSEKRENAE
jgi:hypothetical protein